MINLFKNMILDNLVKRVLGEFKAGLKSGLESTNRISKFDFTKDFKLSIEMHRGRSSIVKNGQKY